MTEERTCPACGAPVVRRSAHAIYCSSSCKDDVSAAKKAARKKTKAPHRPQLGENKP